MHRKGRQILIYGLSLALLLVVPLGASSLAGDSKRRAVKVVRAHGYKPVRSQYHSGQTLRVLTGRKKFGCCALGRKAFFFVRHKGFMRVDVRKATFTDIDVAYQRDKTIAVRYGPLYKRGDPRCCASGDHKTVRFHWNGKAVKALDRIPSEKKRSGYS